MKDSDNKQTYTVLETLHSHSSVVVSRVKVGNEKYIFKYNSNAAKAKRHYQEFIIGSSISSSFVATYLNFKSIQGGHVLIMKDIDGISLNKIIETKREGLNVIEFLEIAIKIVHGLQDIHKVGVIHRDINPFNIVFNPFTRELNIIDFGIASRVLHSEVSPTAMCTNGKKEPRKEREREKEREGEKEREEREGLTGTLQYMSPEQTGRMNRVIDYRSDFYSLGITFYELLTGSTPFSDSKNELDIIYKHTAVTPKKINEVNPKVGQALSDVVSRLLEKNAENRYTSCKGILFDLLKIQRTLQNEEWQKEEERGKKEGRGKDGERGERGSHFVAGSQDTVQTLCVSQHLYGREEEKNHFLKVFESVCAGTESCALVLVHGYSGVGKTVLVNEVHKPLAQQRGYFTSGKYDQFLSASPYSALVKGISGLLRQILTESESKVEGWRQRMMAGLNGQGQLIIDLIPDLALIIGPQPKVQVLSEVESMKRLRHVLTSFIFSLASASSPLVILLDDLQWADTNTLQILSDLVGCPDSLSSSPSLSPLSPSSPHYLMLVGAYRDNEVGEDHPLSHTLNHLKKKGLKVDSVQLGPLQLNNVIMMVKDTFSKISSTEEPEVDGSTLLGDLIFEKTRGNPFFVNQLLQNLYKNGHIKVVEKKKEEEKEEEEETWYWEYDLQRIREEEYTTNVVELMVNSLKRLSKKAQMIIGSAAVIGFRFSLSLLSLSLSLPNNDVIDTLYQAVREGYISSQSCQFVEVAMVSENASSSFSSLNQLYETDTIIYRFGHDRIQQAALMLLNEEEQRRTHLRIAEELIKDDFVETSDCVLEVVNHLKHGLVGESLEYEIKKEGSVINNNSFLPFTAITVSKLTLLAVIRAKNAHAHSITLQYAQQGIAQLKKYEERAWKEHHQLSYELKKLEIEMEIINGHLEEAEKTCYELLERCVSKEESMEIYILLKKRYAVEHRLQEGVQFLSKALGLFNEAFPKKEEQEESFKRITKRVTETIVSQNDMLQFINLPPCNDNLQLSIIKVMHTAFMEVYLLGDRALAGYLAGQIILRSLQHGICAEQSGVALVSFSVMSPSSSYMRDLAEKGMLLLESKYSHSKVIRGAANLIFGAGVAVWYFDVLQGLPYLQLSVDLHQQLGDATWASYAAVHLFEFGLFHGLDLNEVEETYKKNRSFWYECSLGLTPFMEAAAQQFFDLKGIKRDLFDGGSFEESVYNKAPFFKSVHHYVRLFSSFFLRNNLEEWLIHADISSEMTPIFFQGVYRSAEAEVMESLVYLDWLSRSELAKEIFSSSSPSSPSSPFIGLSPRKKGWLQQSLAEITQEKEITQKEVERNKEKELAELFRRVNRVKLAIKNMYHRASICEANFRHKDLLLRAEATKVTLILNSHSIWRSNENEKMEEQLIGKSFEDAMYLYEAAISSAEDFGFQNYQAKALELYGRFWLMKGSFSRLQIKYCLEHFESSIAIYDRWGAKAKVDLMKQEVDALHGISLNHPTKPTSVTESRGLLDSLNLNTVIGAFETISNETDVNSFTLKMIKSIAIHGSAQKVTFFVTDMPNEWEPMEAKKKEREKEGREAEGEREGGSSRDIQVFAAARYDVTNGTEASLIYPMIPLSQWREGPQKVIQFAKRKLAPLILDCAFKDSQYGNDPYVISSGAKSVLCMPIVINKILKGIIYLENNVIEGLYTNKNMELISLLAYQQTISLENMRYHLYQMKQQEERMRLLQIIEEDAVEKYNFIDMICHEIRNPLNAIMGNTDLLFHNVTEINNILHASKYKLNGFPSDIYSSPKRKPSSPTFFSSPSSSTFVSSPSSSSSPSFCLPFPISPSSSSPSSVLCSPLPSRLSCNDYDKLGELLAEIQHSATTIQCCGEHQKCMVDDVLQLSALRGNKLSLKLVKFNTVRFLQNIVDIYKIQAQNKMIQLNFELDSAINSTTELYGDTTRIYQILTNLIGNALKFCMQGEIKICTSVRDIQENHSTREEPSDTVACDLIVKVQDTGIGMSPVEQSRIFHKFMQANDRSFLTYGGSGLGLVISKNLATMMGGNITMTSEKNVGSIFQLIVPCRRFLFSSPGLSSSSSSSFINNVVPIDLAFTDHKKKLEVSVEKEEEEEGKDEKEGHPLRVLVVEDNMMNQALLSRVLRIKGYYVDIANNGEEGFYKFREHSTTEKQKFYDIILMDVQMPIMDGLQATELIRKFEIENELQNDPVCIIGLSGNARDEYKQAAIRSGMNEYLTKPYKKEELYALLTKEKQSAAK